jgi:hypothetical protein
MDRKAYKPLVAMASGSLATPTAPQMTDVTPNRCGEPLALQGGEEVRKKDK